MASISGATQGNKVGGYSSKGFAGMVSGMDTESVVEAMTSDIQAKIDKVKQDQQKNTWRQDAYREAITSLIDFQDKYFSFSSSTNLLSSSFYNCNSMVAGGSNAGKISVNSSSGSATSTYSITGVSQLATKAGFTSGGVKTSGNISTGEISFGDRPISVLTGGSVSVKYGNDVHTIDIPKDAVITDAASLAAALNKSMIENTVTSGGNLADKLKFTADADGKMSLGFVKTGDTNTFSISGGSTEVLNALHMTTGDKEAGGNIIGSAVTTEADLLKTVQFDLVGKNLSFELNGVSKTIEFTKEDVLDKDGNNTIKDMASLQKLLQDKLDAKFGKDKIKVNATNADGTPKNSLDFSTMEDTSTLKISSSSKDTLGEKGIFNLDNGAKNRLDTAKTLKELGFQASGLGLDGKKEFRFKINGKEFAFGEDDAVSKVLSTINNDADAGVNVTFLNTSGRFSVMADESGAQGAVVFEDMSSTPQGGTLMQGNLVEGLFGTEAQRKATEGTDMKMSIRYEGSNSDVEIVRSSNATNIDGISFTANGTFSAYEGSGGNQVYNKDKAISFTAKAETEDVIKAIKTMAEDYNKILDSVNSMTTTKANRDYKPLTDAQRKEMTTDEIKAWEDKAKEGIMFGDSTLNSLTTDLRFLFSASVSNVGAASSIGITTSSSYSDNGKIVIDEKKLKQALETNPEKVKAMFTSSAEASPGTDGNKMFDGGLGVRMQAVMESYAKATGTKKGKLVDMAGIKNNATTANNYITKQQKILSGNLEYLTDLLKTRRDRYQGQFTDLEVYISKMNAQSSWLNSAMS